MRTPALMGVVLFGLLAIEECKDSGQMLDRLAAAGLIHKEAPVQAHLEIQIALRPHGCGASL